jgi:5-methylcytosine-specific restriction endonuclease McrA
MLSGIEMVKDMPKLERDEKGRFVKGASHCLEYSIKAKQTRKETALKKGYYHSEETKNKIGKKNKVSLKGNKLSIESLQKRYRARIKNGWYKNREETLNKISGENSCFWRGGERRKDYCLRFTKHLKNKVKERDMSVCQICGDIIKKNPHSHHIDYNKKNSSIDNLILLCNSCHSKTNFNRRKWLDLLSCFMTLRDTKYHERWNYVNSPLIATYG